LLDLRFSHALIQNLPWSQTSLYLLLIYFYNKLGCVFHFSLFISTGKYVHNRLMSYGLICESDWTIRKTEGAVSKWLLIINLYRTGRKISKN
jgi:hypothetical protein